MGSSEKFCLRWNDFESNISVAFREIREEKDFFDITLSCGSRQIQAHKLILSACSPFFRTVLKQNPHQHPLLYLKGVEFNNLQSVLNFMYHGEVNVAQEELNSFLSVAEELQVKGLTQNNTTSQSANPKREPPPAPVQKHRPPPREPEASPTPKRPRPPPVAPAPRQASYAPAESDDIQEIIPIPVVKTEPQPAPYTPDTSVSMGTMNTINTMDTVETTDTMNTMGTDVANMEDSYVEEGYDDYGGYEGHGYEAVDGQGYGDQENAGAGQQETVDSSSFIALGYNEAGLKIFTCQMCGKGFKKNAHAKTHIENVHSGEQAQCGVCNKVFKNRESLVTHSRVQHGLAKDQIYS